MSELKVNKISPRSGTELTLSDNLLFDTASKGIYLGVTTATASNLLDDYEEGTWTPTFTASSAPTVVYDEQEGTYTKIGRVVILSMKLSTTSVTGGSGSLRVSGVPFNARGGNADPYVYGAKPYASNWTASGNPIDVRMIGTVGIFLYKRTAINGVDTNTQVSDMATSAGNYVGVTITYETD